MPNRIIKDSIVVSKNISDLTDFQFRLWVHLLIFVDDYGRGNADPYIIKGMLFPRVKSVNVAMIEQAIKKLADMGLIWLYGEEGEVYFFFPNWDKHQTIRAKRSRFPEPSENNCKQLQANAFNLQTNASKCGSNTIQSNTKTIQSNQSIKRDDKHGGQNFDQKEVNFSELTNFIE